MFTLHLSIALCPLAVYLLVLGVVNSSRRPLMTTGARDLAALGVAISGLVLAGPMELFFPEDAAAGMGGAWFVWLLLLALYFLGLSLVVLLSRPRLVIYNLPPDQLRPALSEAAARLDSQAIWAGDGLLLPSLGVQLHLEPFGGARSVQLIASGPRQNLAGWRQLQLALGETLSERSAARNPFGPLMLVIGGVLLLIVSLLIFRDPRTVAQSLQELLR